jgi:predicted TIM-barrel fold metal-dependent hydrolase
MAAEKWNENGKFWEDDHGLLDDEQVAQCARANEADPFHSPIPTRMVSNGEYMPIAQTEKQKQVEARIQELTESASKKLGVDRRAFLASTGGVAAAFLAMNEVFGRLFDISPIEMFEPAAYAQSGAPRDLFVFDDQLHLVRGSNKQSGHALRASAQGPTSAPMFKVNPLNPKGLADEHGEPWAVWSPALVGLPMSPENFQLVQFIKDVYLDSQVTIGLLSNVTAMSSTPVGQRGARGGEPDRPPRSIEEAVRAETITAAQTAAARNFVNEVSGSTRMLCHGLLYVGKGNLSYIQEQIDQNQPDSWKGYNISYAAKVDNDPMSPMRQWRHDDEDVAYPTFELIEKTYQKLKDKKPGFKNICVHKGLAPGPPEAERGHPRDLPKALKDWPNLNFITYHSCIQQTGFHADSLETIKTGRQMRDGVPDILWTTEYAQLVAPFKNAYAEIGTTWGSSVVTFPTVAAHIMGQLMKYLGPDRICFGSDCVWYGSPQWQIDALWRFQIPEDMRKKYGYPELTPEAKRKILGLNSAKLYGITPLEGAARDKVYRPVPRDYESRISKELKTIMEFPGYTADNMATFKEKYQALGPEPSHTRYGWIKRT